MRRTWVEQVMGLPVSVLARGPGAGGPEAARAVANLYRELREVDATFSTYRGDSEVSRINSGKLTLLQAGVVVQEIAGRCELATASTGGRFDARTPDGRWDPSGLVKGWAAQRALRLLLEVADVDRCLNAGGDVAVHTADGTPFTVGVQDPHDAQRLIALVPLARGGLATSGTAARGEHLWDPRTGKPATGPLVSVTVVGPALETADVVATAAFVAGAQWAELIEDWVGYEAFAVAATGETYRTPGFPQN